jgi:GNAT superfamily N-acetyltransferase
VPAATADYYFQGSLESSLGTAPDLIEVEKGSSVFTADGESGVTVLRFAGGRGLALSPTTRVIRSSGYSIEILFRFDHLAGFRKVIDFKNGSTGDGLYVLDGCLTFVPKEQEALTRIGSDSYVQVVLTRDAADRVVGYVDGEPAGWVAVEPRENYPRIWARQKAWMRMDPDLEGVWSVTCFVVRKGFRRQGLMYDLAAATVEYGRRVGARVLEGYPTEPPPGKTVIWDEASVGLLQVFLDAGYEVEASPTLRRRVVRHRLGASP